MPATFKRKKSVRKNVERLTRQGAKKALRHLACDDRLESVHQVRKQIKRMRALLRLVRKAITSSDYHKISSGLRKAGRSLAGARDAQVRFTALARLSKDCRQSSGPRPFGQITEVLSGECRRQQNQLARTRARERVGRLLREVSRSSAGFPLKHGGWRALAPGLRRSYGAGRRAYRLSAKAGDSWHFHEWRKRVKDLHYQAGFLERTDRRQLEEILSELKQLGDRLGDEHDLFLLIEPDRFRQLRNEAPKEAAVLRTAVQEQQRKLRAQALALGARIYREKPGAFCHRLGRAWKQWRHVSKRARSELR